MIKKTLLLLILIIFASSCGKKDDPEYKQSKFKYINQEKII